MEVIAGKACLNILLLNNEACLNRFRDVAAVLIYKTGKDLIWSSVKFSYKGNPFLFSIIEADNVCLK